MTIDKLSSAQSNKYITVTFNYDEIRDIANGLYFISTGKTPENEKNYDEIAAKTSFLFDMIKHGNIQESTVRKYANLETKASPSSKENEACAIH